MAAGISQEYLGVMAGMDEASASARMNQYEKGKHHPDVLTVERIAGVLNVPEAYFYARDEHMAWVLIQYHRMGAAKKKALINYIKEMA